MTVAGLREMHKQRRRAAILNAAKELLREGGPDRLTVEALAARAEVAAATVFNLVGPRDRLFTALLDEMVDELAARVGAQLDDARRGGDPLVLAHAVVDGAVGLFLADPAVWRAVVARIGPDLRSAPAGLQKAAFGYAGERGLLHPAAHPEAVGQQVLTSFSGALLMWASGNIDGDDFAALARAGLDLALGAALADETARVAHLARVTAVPYPD